MQHRISADKEKETGKAFSTARPSPTCSTSNIILFIPYLSSRLPDISRCTAVPSTMAKPRLQIALCSVPYLSSRLPGVSSCTAVPKTTRRSCTPGCRRPTASVTGHRTCGEYKCGGHKCGHYRCGECKCGARSAQTQYWWLVLLAIMVTSTPYLAIVASAIPGGYL